MAEETLTYYPNGDAGQEYRNNISYFEKYIKEQRAKRLVYKSELSDLQTKQELLNDRHQHLRLIENEAFYNIAVEALDDKTDQVDGRMVELLLILDKLDTSIKTETKLLIDTKKALAMLGEDTGQVTLSRQELMDALSDNPYIHGLTLYEYSDYNEPVVVWRFMPGITTTVDPNPFRWINNGDPISFELPAIECMLSLKTGILRIRPDDCDESGCYEYYTGEPTVHPHVLDDHDPCLGDFAGPLREAVERADIVSAIGIVQLFLETVDGTDPAGKTFLHRLDINVDEVSKYEFIERYHHETDIPIYKRIYVNDDVTDYDEEFYVLFDGDEMTLDEYDDYLAEKEEEERQREEEEEEERRREEEEAAREDAA